MSFRKRSIRPPSPERDAARPAPARPNDARVNGRFACRMGRVTRCCQPCFGRRRPEERDRERASSIITSPSSEARIASSLPRPPFAASSSAYTILRRTRPRCGVGRPVLRRARSPASVVRRPARRGGAGLRQSRPMRSGTHCFARCCTSGRRRRRARSSIARWGPRSNGSAPPACRSPAAELAMHFERGRDPMTALRYYAEAAEAALSHLSPAECMTLTERALSPSRAGRRRPPSGTR